jgi:EAL domain-containing protein (putative c-di-GMP-specific phosphodiesterase class I)
LYRFPFYKLKIDRAFVSNIAKDIASNRLVDVIASSAIDMELDIVAEGIEERQEFGTYTGFGCH